jgi:hypothetical protein
MNVRVKEPARYERLPQYGMVYLWKRRSVIAPSAPQTEREEHLYVLWNKPEKGPERPTKHMLEDPILSSLWVMKTGWCYAVGTSVKGFMGNHVANVVVYAERKSALEEYKRRSKNLTRSKEIDYGFPAGNDSGHEDEDGA